MNPSVETTKISGMVKREAFTVSRFTIVGGVAAIVHISIVWILIDQLNWQPLFANLVAFLIAFIVSFSGQYWWTFRSNRTWHNALVRFFLVSIAAFCANTIVLSVLLSTGLLSNAMSAVIAALVIPAFTYILGRFWAFS